MENTVNAINNFLQSDIVSVVPVKEGHINQTFFVQSSDSKYVLQCLQKNLDVSKLEYNYSLYSKVFEEAGLSFPCWLKNRDGKHYYGDEYGNTWRMYNYLETEKVSVPLSDELLRECGRGLQRMHSAFASVREKPQALYPYLHDLSRYYNTYTETAKKDRSYSEKRNKNLDLVIDKKISKMLSVNSGRKQPVHGDTKLSNLVFKNGKAVGFLDMDTFMQGSIPEDVADCIRSVCISEGKFDKEAAVKILDGYTEGLDKTQSYEIKELIPDVFNKICFELGLRYYIDYLSGDNYFNLSNPAECINRAENLMSILW